MTQDCSCMPKYVEKSMSEQNRNCARWEYVCMYVYYISICKRPHPQETLDWQCLVLSKDSVWFCKAVKVSGNVVWGLNFPFIIFRKRWNVSVKVFLAIHTICIYSVGSLYLESIWQRSQQFYFDGQAYQGSHAAVGDGGREFHSDCTRLVIDLLSGKSA